MNTKQMLSHAKKITREINGGKETFFYNGKVVDYAVSGLNDFGQAVFILGYDGIRETQCVMDSNYLPFIIKNEIKFLQTSHYYTF